MKTKLSGYTGEKVPVKGCIATFKLIGKQIKAMLLIVEMSVKPILGLQACQ